MLRFVSFEILKVIIKFIESKIQVEFNLINICIEKKIYFAISSFELFENSMNLIFTLFFRK